MVFGLLPYCCHSACLSQAHVAPVTQLDQVKAVVAVLLESNKIRNATHNIMAYRIAAPGKPGVFYQDFDDDGEAAAGGRLLHLLQVITHWS
jgi:putative IMPACT (imprinted ancient) family translation regulator